MLYAKKETIKIIENEGEIDASPVETTKIITTEVDDNWPDTIKNAQIEILVLDGYKPVVETEKPANVWYGIWTPEYEEDEDVFRKVWVFNNIAIKLDKGKVLAAIDKLGMMDAYKSIFETDETARNWWINNCFYVDGSPMANYVQEKLHMTKEQLRSFIELCIKKDDPPKPQPDPEEDEEEFEE